MSLKKGRRDMKKSVYSVVLSDNVISEIDKLAYINGTNRSNMINQILAEYVSLITPEKRIQNVFDELSSLLFVKDDFKLMNPPSHSSLSLSSALSYKYNPTVKYVVELYRDVSRGDGEIRVSMRTQNAVLISEMINFYRLWTGIEEHYGYRGEVIYKDGVFTRKIIIRNSPFYRGEEKNISVADMIAEYIYLFDKAMKTYFSSDGSAEEIERMYLVYLNKNGKII